MKSQNHFKVSLHHTPVEGYHHIFHSVLRAGHYRIVPDYPMRSWSRPGHDILLGLSGAGPVQIGNRMFVINSGEVGWVDCQHHDVHWPSRSNMWEFLWIRVDSPLLSPVVEALGVEVNPIFMPGSTAATRGIFKDIFCLLRTRPLNMDAALHAAMSTLIAILFDARQSPASEMWHETRGTLSSHAFARVLNAMRDEYRRRWNVKDLAQLVDLSVPQFYRRFNLATGSSPINWLRRERINHAKRRLGETQDRICNIAQDLGYADALYFSRDFKKLVGVSPLHYRLREQPKVEKPA